MKYKVLKEAALKELLTEDWEGRSHDERRESNDKTVGELADTEILKPRHLTKTEMRKLPRHVTDRRQQLADLDAEERGEGVPVADKADAFIEYSDVADDWDSYNDNSDVVRLRNLNETPMSRYVQLKDDIDHHANKLEALVGDPMSLGRLFDLAAMGKTGRAYAAKLLKYATGVQGSVLGGEISDPWAFSLGTQRRTKRVLDW